MFVIMNVPQICTIHVSSAAYDTHFLNEWTLENGSNLSGIFVYCRKIRFELPSFMAEDTLVIEYNPLLAKTNL